MQRGISLQSILQVNITGIVTKDRFEDVCGGVDNTKWGESVAIHDISFTLNRLTHSGGLCIRNASAFAHKQSRVWTYQCYQGYDSHFVSSVAKSRRRRAYPSGWLTSLSSLSASSSIPSLSVLAAANNRSSINQWCISRLLVVTVVSFEVDMAHWLKLLGSRLRKEGEEVLILTGRHSLYVLLLSAVLILRWPTR